MCNTRKKFEFYIPAKCNDCAHYWDSSCDGSEQEIECRSFVAKRSVDVTKRLEKLEREILLLKLGVVVEFIMTAILLWRF